MAGSSSKTQSVLCVLEPQNHRIHSPAIIGAQEYAVAQKLPLAVVICVSDKNELPKLLEIESQLAKYSIPLLTLIGDFKQRIDATAYHLQPKRIYHETEAVEKKPVDLIVHPFTWPGRIASVQELIDTDGQAC
jgi:hypothetical protein